MTHVKQTARFAAAAVLLGLLSGCAAIHERNVARDNATCASYGFHPDTEAFANCRMAIDQGRKRDDGAADAAATGAILRNGNQLIYGR